MTPDDSDDRRIAEELRRRERQGSKSDTALDPTTLAALHEKHEATIEQMVARSEAALMERIDSLARAQGAAVESLRRETGRQRKGDADETAALVRRFGDEQRAAMKELLAGLKREFDALKASLDSREGAVFAGIDHVAETVAPGARALAGMQQNLAGSTDAAREAAANSRRAFDETVATRKIVADNDRANADRVAMKPVLEAIAESRDTFNASLRRERRQWLWFGWTMFVVVALGFAAGGAWLQKETGIWEEMEVRERDAFWERHGDQVMHCIEEARNQRRDMSCIIVDMDP